MAEAKSKGTMNRQVAGGGAAGGSRHVYSACAVGVGAVLTSPALEGSWAASCLPIIGGSSSRTEGPIVWPSSGDPVLRFELARTEVTGRPGPGASDYTTTMRKTVTGLNILNRVKASIDLKITFKYTANGTPTNDQQRDPVQVTIDPLRLDVSIDGAPVVFSLKPEIPDQAGQNFKQFRQDINGLRSGKKHLKHEHGEGGKGGHHQGVIFTALAEPEASFKYEDPDFGRVDVPGLGSVYFGEWHGEPYHQSFTVLRVELQNVQDAMNPRGFFTGQIVIDGDENGRG